MRKIFLFILFFSVVKCVPKISSSVEGDILKVVDELKASNFNLSGLKIDDDEILILETELNHKDVNTNREKAALQLKEGERTKIIKDADGSCGTIIMKKINQKDWVRVSYIYLADKTEAGEELADKILSEYKDGETFETLASKYSQDTNKNKGGDLGLVAASILAKDFVASIRNHKKGDIYKTLTKDFGWYVILNTEGIMESFEYEVIEIFKKDCN